MKAKITYARLQEKVAAATGTSRREADRLLKEISSMVGTGLVADGKVNLAGLGRFSLKVQSARRGRNPRTGESIEIPEKKRVHFLPDAQWRRHVNREYEQMKPVPAQDTAAATAPNTEKASRTPVVPAAPAPETGPKPPPPQVKEHRPPPHPKAPEKEVSPPTATSEPESPGPLAADTEGTPPIAAGVRKRKSPMLAAIVILLVAAALFLFWPRSQTPLPPEPEPVRVATSRDRPPPAEIQPVEKQAPEPVDKPEPVASAPSASPIIAVPAVMAAQTEVTTPSQPEEKPVQAPAYTVAAGDSLWKISDAIYRYAYFWPLIFQENQPQLKHPDTLLVGMRLAVPTFAGQVGQLSENEFQQLADGYLRVYQVYQRNRHPRAPYYLWVAYRLRAHWIPDNDLMLGEPEDYEFIRQIRGQGLIH